jgi:hypothetical protein
MDELLNDDVYICIDCYMDHHEGRAMKDASVDWTDNNASVDDEEEDMTIDFSSMACGCCGTTLAGQRFRMAIWSKD